MKKSIVKYGLLTIIFSMVIDYFYHDLPVVSKVANIGHTAKYFFLGELLDSNSFNPIVDLKVAYLNANPDTLSPSIKELVDPRNQKGDASKAKALSIYLNHKQLEYKETLKTGAYYLIHHRGTALVLDKKNPKKTYLHELYERAKLPITDVMSLQDFELEILVDRANLSGAKNISPYGAAEFLQMYDSSEKSVDYRNSILNKIRNKDTNNLTIAQIEAGTVFLSLYTELSKVQSDLYKNRIRAAKSKAILNATPANWR